jgi:molybdate transport system substrate-binding protein
MKALYLLLVLLLAFTFTGNAQQVTVAAAADLRPALDEISIKFKTASGISLRVSYGSSGNFFQQLQNGAPFDVFLCANLDYPKKLQAAGLVASNSYYEFAQGSIVLLLPKASNVNVNDGLRLLLSPEVRKIAIADPAHAPYGQAAVAALKKEGLYEQVAPKLVTGENISQAASFVLSGAADAGIIARSLAMAPVATQKAKFVLVPATDYPPIVQAMVVLSASKTQDAAMKFEVYMRSDAAKDVLKHYGFGISGE